MNILVPDYVLKCETDEDEAIWLRSFFESMLFAIAEKIGKKCLFDKFKDHLAWFKIGGNPKVISKKQNARQC